jgi:hypothetical protein
MLGHSVGIRTPRSEGRYLDACPCSPPDAKALHTYICLKGLRRPHTSVLLQYVCHTCVRQDRPPRVERFFSFFLSPSLRHENSWEKINCCCQLVFDSTRLDSLLFIATVRIKGPTVVIVDSGSDPIGCRHARGQFLTSPIGVKTQCSPLRSSKH